MELDWLYNLWKYKIVILCYLAVCAILILHNNNISLRQSIAEKQNVMNALSAENDAHLNQISNLQNKIMDLETENQELKAEIAKGCEHTNTNDNTSSNTTFGVFKSYTDYKCLSKNSAQWQLQKKAYTDENGLRKIGDAYLVALGSYYGTKLGTEYTVVLSNGNTFNIMLCDLKKDIHTDSQNKTTLSDGSVLEFYIDTDKVPTKVKRLGDVSAISFFSGAIISITKK